MLGRLLEIRAVLDYIKQGDVHMDVQWALAMKNDQQIASLKNLIKKLRDDQVEGISDGGDTLTASQLLQWCTRSIDVLQQEASKCASTVFMNEKKYRKQELSDPKASGI